MGLYLLRREGSSVSATGQEGRGGGGDRNRRMYQGTHFGGLFPNEKGRGDEDDASGLYLGKAREMIRKEEYEDGVKAGEARGEVRGIEKGVAKVAANMLAQNMSEEIILQITGLTLQELQRIRSIGDV